MISGELTTFFQEKEKKKKGGRGGGGGVSCLVAGPGYIQEEKRTRSYYVLGGGGRNVPSNYVQGRPVKGEGGGGEKRDGKSTPQKKGWGGDYLSVKKKKGKRGGGGGPSRFTVTERSRHEGRRICAILLCRFKRGVPPRSASSPKKGRGEEERKTGTIRFRRRRKKKKKKKKRGRRGSPAQVILKAKPEQKKSPLIGGKGPKLTPTKKRTLPINPGEGNRAGVSVKTTLGQEGGKTFPWEGGEKKRERGDN